MDENRADAVDKDMFSLVKKTLALQSLKYIFKDGKWRRLWDDQKKEILLRTVNKLIEMEEVKIKRKHSYRESQVSYLNYETSSDQLISILQVWKRIKETNEYKHIKIEYTPGEEPKQIKTQ